MKDVSFGAGWGRKKKQLQGVAIKAPSLPYLSFSGKKKGGRRKGEEWLKWENGGGGERSQYIDRIPFLPWQPTLPTQSRVTVEGRERGGGEKPDSLLLLLVPPSVDLTWGCKPREGRELRSSIQ